MLCIWIVAVVFAAAITNAAVFETPIRDYYDGEDRLVYEGSQNMHYVDGQCRNLNNTYDVSLEVCMQICKTLAGCNALNYKESEPEPSDTPLSHCDLRNCPDYPEEFPEVMSYSYQAYQRTRDVYDCYDYQPECPMMALMGECDRNSTFVSGCKRSCEECKCPEGYFNVIGYSQCLKKIEDVHLNWEESKIACQEMGLRLPEYIGGGHEELPYPLSIDEFWLNGRGDGKDMILQHSKILLRNVSCNCEPEEQCKHNIGSNQCLTTTSYRGYEPIHCLHTHPLLCEGYDGTKQMTQLRSVPHPFMSPTEIMKDCPLDQQWNVCKNECWGPSCHKYCNDGECHKNCRDFLPYVPFAPCKWGFKFDSSKDKCVRIWKKKRVV